MPPFQQLLRNRYFTGQLLTPTTCGASRTTRSAAFVVAIDS